MSVQSAIHISVRPSVRVRGWGWLSHRRRPSCRHEVIDPGDSPKNEKDLIIPISPTGRWWMISSRCSNKV